MGDYSRDLRLAERGSAVILLGSNPEPRMSQLGHQRTWRLRFVMSALTQQADINRRLSQVRFGPIVLQKSFCVLDHKIFEP